MMMIIVMIVVKMTFYIRIILSDSVFFHVPIYVLLFEFGTFSEIVWELRFLHRMPQVKNPIRWDRLSPVSNAARTIWNWIFFLIKECIKYILSNWKIMNYTVMAMDVCSVRVPIHHWLKALELSLSLLHRDFFRIYRE